MSSSNYAGQAKGEAHSRTSNSTIGPGIYPATKSGSFTANSSSQPDVPPYSSTEKEWLKKNWGSEFKFLLAYQLSIYKDEDRAEGRAIARAMMEADDGDANAYDDDEEDANTYDEDEDEEPQFLRDLEADPASHVADYHFSSQELDFIEEKYGHSGNFLRTLGLKPWDDEDCREGKVIVQQFMSDSRNE